MMSDADAPLSEEDVDPDPLRQFERWFAEAKQAGEIVFPEKDIEDEIQKDEVIKAHQAEIARQFMVQDRHPRRPERGGPGRGEEDARQPRVGVVKPPTYGVGFRNRCSRNAHPVSRVTL